jgi:hypothetical protein
MKTKLILAFAISGTVVLSSFSFARPARAPQDQPAVAQDQAAAQKGSHIKKPKTERSPGKEVGKGGEDIGKGAGKGAESLGKGTAGAAVDVVTLHPVGAATDLGVGAAGAGKDVGVGTAKGTAKIGKGSARGIGKLGGKLFHRGGKKKPKE